MGRVTISDAGGNKKCSQDAREVKTISSDELKRFLLEALFSLQDKNYEAAKKAMSHYEGFDNIFFSRVSVFVLLRSSYSLWDWGS